MAIEAVQSALSDGSSDLDGAGTGGAVSATRLPFQCAHLLTTKLVSIREKSNATSSKKAMQHAFHPTGKPLQALKSAIDVLSQSRLTPFIPAILSVAEKLLGADEEGVKKVKEALAWKCGEEILSGGRHAGKERGSKRKRRELNDVENT
jgi:hypothetical protein